MKRSQKGARPKMERRFDQSANMLCPLSAPATYIQSTLAPLCSRHHADLLRPRQVAASCSCLNTRTRRGSANTNAGTHCYVKPRLKQMQVRWGGPRGRGGSRRGTWGGGGGKAGGSLSVVGGIATCCLFYCASLAIGVMRVMRHFDTTWEAPAPAPPWHI
jgi:hypothetical protein